MYEQVLESLIERYRSQGLSVDRVLLDPAYRSMPMPEKVKVIVKYGNAIKAGQKIDGTFMKDLGLGLAGTAYLALPVVKAVGRIAGAGLYTGIYKGNLPTLVGPPRPTPPRNAAERAADPRYSDPKDADMLIRTILAGGVTTSSLNQAHKAYKIRQVVKKFLSDKEPITQAQAIEVVSRTL